MKLSLESVQAISLEEMVNINGGFDEAAYQSGKEFGNNFRKALEGALIIIWCFW
jgi:hypothetical protein